jgi:hypothetical protein
VTAGRYIQEDSKRILATLKTWNLTLKIGSFFILSSLPLIRTSYYINRATGMNQLYKTKKLDRGAGLWNISRFKAEWELHLSPFYAKPQSFILCSILSYT